MWKFCIVLVLAGILVGCAVNKPITPTQFMFRCIMKPSPGYSSDGGGSCGEQYDICQAFQTEMMSVKDGASCKRVCRDTKNKFYQRFIVDNCRWTIKQAYDLCTLYCMSNYN